MTEESNALPAYGLAEPAPSASPTPDHHANTRHMREAHDAKAEVQPPPVVIPLTTLTVTADAPTHPEASRPHLHARRRTRHGCAGLLLVAAAGAVYTLRCSRGGGGAADHPPQRRPR